MPVVCSISGYPPEDPVISRDGYIFERRLIEKVIRETGKCPVTGSQLNMEDLRPVLPTNGAKALPIDSVSLPDMIKAFESEWDRVFIESFSLKSQLDGLQEELAKALYEQEAAGRIIAQLTKERDTALTEVKRLQEELGDAHYNMEH